MITPLKYRLSFIFLTTLFTSSFLLAGETALLRSGSSDVIPLKPGQSAVEAIEEYQEPKNLSRYHRIDKTEALPIVESLHPPESSEPELLNRDEYELRWNDGSWEVNFGFDTGDSIAQWFVPLAGAIVKKILIRSVNFVGTVEFFIHGSNYEGEATTGSCADVYGWVGLYDTLTGEWIAGGNECFNQPPLGEELWPDSGNGGFTVDFDSSSFMEYVEIDLGVFGYPDVGSNPFFIDGFVTRTDGWGFYALGSPEVPYHGFKYYDSTGTSGNPGWHIRSYGWDLYVMVEYYEDTPPFIENVTQVSTSISHDPREIEATIWDENPAGGDSGVAEAWLYWEVEEVMDSVQMTFEGDSIYSGFAPGYIPGMSSYTYVSYWVGAVDVMGNWSYSGQYIYVIVFGCRYLLIYNSDNISIESPHLYFQGVLEGCPYDLWSVGSLGQVNYVLLQNYTTVIEVQPGGPLACTMDLDSWLDEGGKNYIVTGDEWLGECYDGWDPLDTQPGDFLYDYMGIDQTYPDISGQSTGVSRLLPMSGDTISGELAAFLADSLLLNYDPNYEIGEHNYLDGVEPVAGAHVSYYGVTGVLDSNFVPTGTDTVPTAVYYELDNGSKTAFFGFDALSLNSMSVAADALHDMSQGYHWIGVYPEGPIPQALLWMDAYGSVVDNKKPKIPESFVLHQPYPNPFNPTTTVEFSVPASSVVSLTVYDILGRELDTILNQPMDAGNHSVQWNAVNFPSGIYFIKMVSDNFTQTRKVMVLK